MPGVPRGHRGPALDVNEKFSFDPDRVAALETEAWRAYYDREWLKLLYCTERGCAEQFHIPFPTSLEAAYWATRGAIAFKPLDNDVPTALGACERYYELVRRYSGLQFDPASAAQAEVRYWEVHRRLSGAPDHRELVDTFADLHAVTFGIARERAVESAELRTRAAILVDGITGRVSNDVDGDWMRLAAELRSCYRSLLAELRSNSS